MYKWNVSEPITFGSDDTLLSPSSADTDNAEAQPNNKMGKLHRLFRQYVTKESQQEHSLLLDEMRWEHSMFTLERHKDRFFVFGGSNSNGKQKFNDVLEFTRVLHESNEQWHCRSIETFACGGYNSAASVPCARDGHTTIVFKNSATQQEEVCLFGGVDIDNQYLSDMWILNCSSWEWRRVSLKTGDGPCARSQHTAVFVEGSKEHHGQAPTMWIYGGFDGHRSLGDLWYCDLETINFFEVTSLSTVAKNSRLQALFNFRHSLSPLSLVPKDGDATSRTAPPPRHGHTATVVSFSETVETTPSTSSSSSSEDRAHTIFDRKRYSTRHDISSSNSSGNNSGASRNVYMIVCFGYSLGNRSTTSNALKKLYSVGGDYLDDIWCFNFSNMTWTNLTTNFLGKMPSARTDHAASNIGRGCIFLFGGMGTHSSFKKDAFVIDLAQRKVQEVPRIRDTHRTLSNKHEWPQSRKGHVQWFDSVSNNIIVHGGGNSKKGVQYDNICSIDREPLFNTLRVGKTGSSNGDLTSPSKQQQQQHNRRRSSDIKSKLAKIDSLSEKISHSPNELDLLLQRAEQFSLIGAFRKALIDYTKAADILKDENNARAHKSIHLGLSVDVSRANCLYKLGNFGDALSLLEECLAEEKTDSYGNAMNVVVRGLIVSAKCRFGMCQYQASIGDCNRTIRLFSDASNKERKELIVFACKAYRIKINCYIHLRKLDLAESSIETAKLLTDELKSKSKREYLLQKMEQLGTKLAVKREAYHTALEYVQQARDVLEQTSVNNDDSDADEMSAGNPRDAADQAISLLENALDHDAGCEEALAELLEILYRQQQHKQAMHVAKSLITVNPSHIQAYVIAGRCLIANRKLTKAIDLLTQAMSVVSVDEQDPIRSILDTAKNMKESYEEALMHATKAEEFEIQNMLEDALEQYELALRQDPRNLKYVTARANLLSRMNRIREAIDAGYLAIELDPTSHLGYLTVGTTLISAQCYEDAIDILQDGLDNALKQDSLHQQLRVARDRIQRIEQARALLHSAIDSLEAIEKEGDPLLTTEVMQSDTPEFSQEKREQLEEILEILNKSITLFELDIDAFIMRARCKYLLRRFMSCVADCLHALDIITAQRKLDEEGRRMFHSSTVHGDEQDSDPSVDDEATMHMLEQQTIEEAISLAVKAHASMGQIDHVDKFIKTQLSLNKNLLSKEQVARLKTLQKDIDSNGKIRGKAMRKYQKGRLFSQNGKFADAVKQYTMALSLHRVDDLSQSSLNKILFERADAYFHLDMLELCMRDCQEAMSPVPMPHHIVLNAICLAKLGRLEESVRSIHKALATMPFNMPLNDVWLVLKYRLVTSRCGSLFKLGEKLMRKCEFDDAIDRLSEVISIDPHHSLAYLLRGRCLYNTNRLARALKDIEKCITSESLDKTQRVEAHYLHGCILVKRRRVDEAALAYTTAIELDPDCVKAQNRMEELEELMFRGSQSESLYQQARDMIEQISHSAMDVDTFALYRARSLLTRAIHLDPANARFYVKRALISLDLMMSNKALDDAEIAVTLDPAEAGGLVAKTLALMEMSRYQEAHETLDEAMDVEGDSPELQSIRAELTERESRSQNALELHESGVKLMKEIEASRVQSTNNSAVEEKIEKALKFLTQASNYEPMNFKYQRDYISCLLLHPEQEYWEEALQATHVMVRLHPSRVEAYELLTSLCIDNSDLFTALFAVCQGIDACKREEESTAYDLACTPLLNLLMRIVEMESASDILDNVEGMTVAISWDDPSSVEQFQDQSEREFHPESISLEDTITSFERNNDSLGHLFRDCITPEESPHDTASLNDNYARKDKMDYHMLNASLYEMHSPQSGVLIVGLELAEKRKMMAFRFALQALYILDNKNDINHLCKLISVDEVTKVQYYSALRERGLMPIITSVACSRFKALQDGFRFHDSVEHINSFLKSRTGKSISVADMPFQTDSDKFEWRMQLQALIDQLYYSWCGRNNHHEMDAVGNLISILTPISEIYGFGPIFPILLLLEKCSFDVRNSVRRIPNTYEVTLILVQQLLQSAGISAETVQNNHGWRWTKWRLEDQEANVFGNICKYITEYAEYVINNHFASKSPHMDNIIRICFKNIELLHLVRACLLEGSNHEFRSTKQHGHHKFAYTIDRGIREWLQERIETSAGNAYALMKSTVLEGADSSSYDLTPVQLIRLANLIKRFLNVYEIRFEPVFVSDAQIMLTVTRKFFDLYWAEIKNCRLKQIVRACDVTLMTNAHSVEIPDGTFLLPFSVKQLFQYLTEYAGSILRPFKVFSLVEPFIICWLNQYQHKMISWAMRSNELDNANEWKPMEKALHTSSVVDVFMSVNQGLETIYGNFEFLSEASAMEQHDRGNHFQSAFSLIYFTYMDIVRNVVVQYVSDLSKRLREHASKLYTLHGQQKHQQHSEHDASFEDREKQILKAMCLMINNANMSRNNLDNFIQDMRQQLVRVDLPVWEGYSDHIHMAKKDLQEIIDDMILILERVSLRPLIVQFSASLRHMLSSPWTRSEQDQNMTQATTTATTSSVLPQQQRRKNNKFSKLFKRRNDGGSNVMQGNDAVVQTCINTALMELLDGFDSVLSILNKIFHKDSNLFQQVLLYAFDRLVLEAKEVILPPITTVYQHLTEEHLMCVRNDIVSHIKEYFLASGQGICEEHVENELSLLVFLMSCHLKPTYELVEQYSRANAAAKEELPRNFIPRSCIDSEDEEVEVIEQEHWDPTVIRNYTLTFLYRKARLNDETATRLIRTETIAMESEKNRLDSEIRMLARLAGELQSEYRQMKTEVELMQMACNEIKQENNFLKQLRRLGYERKQNRKLNAELMKRIERTRLFLEQMEADIAANRAMHDREVNYLTDWRPQLLEQIRATDAKKQVRGQDQYDQISIQVDGVDIMTSEMPDMASISDTNSSVGSLTPSSTSTVSQTNKSSSSKRSSRDNRKRLSRILQPFSNGLQTLFSKHTFEQTHQSEDERARLVQQIQQISYPPSDILRLKFDLADSSRLLTSFFCREASSSLPGQVHIIFDPNLICFNTTIASGGSNKLTIPFEDIVQIATVDKPSLRDGIKISTSSARSYVFCGIDNRDAMLDELIKLFMAICPERHLEAKTTDNGTRVVLLRPASHNSEKEHKKQRQRKQLDQNGQQRDRGRRPLRRMSSLMFLKRQK